MPSSESEDFESADEGSTVDKKEKKKRLSSSNYSDSPLEGDQGLTKPPTKGQSSDKTMLEKKTADGWDDFELDEDEAIDSRELPVKANEPSKQKSSPVKVENDSSQDTGWDDFGDWGDNDGAKFIEKEPPKPLPQKPEPSNDIKEVTDRMAAASTGGWGWGWTVDSLLSSATAGISNITTQVSQGISTVLETGIGAPDPEELAKRSKESRLKEPQVKPEAEPQHSTDKSPTNEGSGDAFPAFGSLLSGVTKFVETTGTKVLNGGLDTLESIGKVSMEVLQKGDPGLAKKKAMLGLDTDKPNLSHVLREAKAKSDEEDRIRDKRREAKEVHYETLFDDFEGLVYLEALEMLSRQVSMRIEECIRLADTEKRQDIKETLQQVAELCEMPDDDDEDSSPEDGNRADAFHERLQVATQDLGLKLQFQPLVKQYTETLEWLSTTELTDKTTYKRCLSSLAQATALSVHAYHKAAELLLTKPRRSTADEADALTQMTVVLTKHIGELATLFTDKMNSVPTDNKEQINTYITNIFLEAGNSSTYIQNAFQLTLPILQIGAV